MSNPVKSRLIVRGLTRMLSQVQQKGLTPYIPMAHQFETELVTRQFSRPETVQTHGENTLRDYALKYYINEIRRDAKLRRDVGGTKWIVETRNVTVEFV